MKLLNRRFLNLLLRTIFGKAQIEDSIRLEIESLNLDLVVQSLEETRLVHEFLTVERKSLKANGSWKIGPRIPREEFQVGVCRVLEKAKAKLPQWTEQTPLYHEVARIEQVRKELKRTESGAGNGGNP